MIGPMANISPEKQKQKKANLTAFSLVVAACCAMAAALPFLEAAKTPLWTGPLVLAALLGVGLLSSWRRPTFLKIGAGLATLGASGYLLFLILLDALANWADLSAAAKQAAQTDGLRCLFWTGFCAAFFALHARATGRMAIVAGAASLIFGAGYIFGLPAPW